MSTRRPQAFTSPEFSIDFAHPAITATTAFRLPWVAPAAYRITGVFYVNQTGLAGDGTDAFAGLLADDDGNTVASLFNTDTGDVGGASLAAATVVDATVVEAQAVGAAGDMLDLTFTEDGTATLPAGNLRVEGYYL